MEEPKISEWNEGTLKSLRLHEAQSMINFTKISPFELFPLGLGYECWIKGVDMLFGEGEAKYTTKELADIDKMRDSVRFALDNNPPATFGITYVAGRKKNNITINKKNWINLRKLTELYERLVKIYNDKHGLSTRNKGHSGMF